MILHVISCNIYLCGRIENVGLLEHFCLEFSFVTDVKTAASTSFSNCLLALTVDVEPDFYSTDRELSWSMTMNKGVPVGGSASGIANHCACQLVACEFSCTCSDVLSFGYN